jgi:2-methylcitrate dehydratase
MESKRNSTWEQYDSQSASSVSHRFAQYALDISYEKLPTEVIHEGKRTLLDTLGCAIGGYRAPGRPCIENAIKEMPGEKESTAFGTGLQTSALNAALVNSFLVRFLDYSDVGVGSYDRVENRGNHGSDAIASILALCERQKKGGKALLESIVVSYELGARISDTSPALLQKFTSQRPPSFLDTRANMIMPPALGRLLDLNEIQMVNAIGICASHSFALGVIMREEPTMSKDIRFGYIAHDAILCCILAKNGFTGPVRVFESDAGLLGLSNVAITHLQTDMNHILDLSGWRILETRYKFLRGCAGLHGMAQCTLAIVRENDLKPEDIKAVTVKCNPGFAASFGRPLFKYPRVAEAADHSPYFTNAMAIKERKLSYSSYETENFTDPVVVGLIDKITVLPEPSMADKYTEGGVSEIITNDGRRFEKRIETPHGFYHDPLTDAEIEEKFIDMASQYMPEKQINKIIETVWNIDKIDNVRDLAKLMVWKIK